MALLYDTFGDKRSLFLNAIAYYEQTVIKEMLNSLNQENSPKQAIINLFRDK